MTLEGGNLVFLHGIHITIIVHSSGWSKASQCWAKISWTSKLSQPSFFFSQHFKWQGLWIVLSCINLDNSGNHNVAIWVCPTLPFGTLTLKWLLVVWMVPFEAGTSTCNCVNTYLHNFWKGEAQFCWCWYQQWYCLHLPTCPNLTRKHVKQFESHHLLGQWEEPVEVNYCQNNCQVGCIEVRQQLGREWICMLIKLWRQFHLSVRENAFPVLMYP